MYYRHTVLQIRLYLSRQGFVSRKDPDSVPSGDHILWMCDEIENMNEWSVFDATKAGRWIGWMLGAIELGRQARIFNGSFPWTNQISRDLARKDVWEGLSLPKWLRWLSRFKRR